MPAELQINNRILSDVQLCIFDKDGTIIDVHTYWANMVRLRAEFIGKALGLDEATQTGIMESMGVDTKKMLIKSDGPVGLKKKEIVLKSGVDYLLAKGYPDCTRQFVSIFRKVDAHSLDLFNNIIKPMPQVHSVFSQLKSADCFIALATTDIRERAIHAMKHLNLLEFVDDIVGADGVQRPKPNPEIILTICEKLCVPVEKSIMVGDAKSDVMTGINAGCLASIAVESGLTPREYLAALTPFVIPDVSHISVIPNVGIERLAKRQPTS